MGKRIYVEKGGNISHSELVKWFYYKDGELFLRYDIKRRNQLADEPMRYQISKDGYRRYHINGKLYSASRLIFFWHHKYLPDFVDHEDTDRQNNKIDNLREATKSGNCTNRNSMKNASSKYLGVHKNVNHWEASIRKFGKSKWLGNFKSEEAAALEYNKHAVMLHGEFARLNIITPNP
jgi:HNH endonuclease